jgi:hypothetical protein
MRHRCVMPLRVAKLAVCPTQLALEDMTVVIILLTLTVDGIWSALLSLLRKQGGSQ